MRSLQGQAQWLTRLQAVLAAAIVVGAACFVVAGYRPATARLRALQMQIDTARRTLDQNTNRTRTMPILQVEVAQLESKVAAYDKQFPRQPELPEFIRDLTRLCQASSLHEWKYNPSMPQKVDSFFQLPIHMHFEGDFVNVASFLRQVEDMARLTRVGRLTVRCKDTKAGRVEVEAVVSIFFSEG